MLTIVLALATAQAPPPNRIVEDTNSTLPSLHCLRAFRCDYEFAREQDYRHRRHAAWLCEVAESKYVARDGVQKWQQESNFRAVCWECLHTAFDKNRSECSRREALDLLQNLIGAERFYRGVMPSAMPIIVYQKVHIPVPEPVRPIKIMNINLR